MNFDVKGYYLNIGQPFPLLIMVLLSICIIYVANVFFVIMFISILPKDWHVFSANFILSLP